MSRPILAFGPEVLLVAMLAPSGTAGRLLQYAPLGIYQAHIAPGALAEAERLGRAGAGGRAVAEAEVLAFRAAIAELIAKDDAVPASAVQVGAPEAALEALLAGKDPA